MSREPSYMVRPFALIAAAALALAACADDSVPTRILVGSDGNPLPQVYRIAPGDKAKIQFRMLDSVNALRKAAGVRPVELDPRLIAAAATHARDMSIQNRPWHFGSDGSSPLDRVQRAGYRGTLVGEVISETYETETQTLAAWMESPDTRAIILDPRASHMGIGYFQEQSGKIWWTMVLGAPPRPATTAGL